MRKAAAIEFTLQTERDRDRYLPSLFLRTCSESDKRLAIVQWAAKVMNTNRKQIEKSL